MKCSCTSCKHSECKVVRKSFQLHEFIYSCKKGNKIQDIDRGCQDWEKRKL